MYIDSYSKISFLEYSNVSFDNNRAFDGGGMLATTHSKISFEDHALVDFCGNQATISGGAGYLTAYCTVTFKHNSNVKFENNNALFGGAIYLHNESNITFEEESNTLFNKNTATNNGGAINILINSSVLIKNHAGITFSTNVGQYGGAMYFDTTHTTFTLNGHENSTLNFISNAGTITGDSIYFESTGSSEENYLNNRIIGIENKTKRFITTPPRKLEFYDLAKCTDDDNESANCDTYYVNHLMLGEEVNIPVCVLDYCNQHCDPTQFFMQGDNNQNYSINAPSQVLLSCGTNQLISIIGTESLSKSLNYSINFTLNDHRNSNWKKIYLNLTVELVPCYPGFWHYAEKCKCYNGNDIVFCFDSSSTIKRGYWFGNMTGKPTVTFCPINYCNFTCCETVNGYYHLSPVRTNQCRSHRSGAACGSCVHGYTLSFDSTECVDVKTCTAGQTVLVTLLTVIYWIVMVTLGFALMYYKVGIGYLYSITYYYSIVDIILSQILYSSGALQLTVSIMSSFSKIIPQCLGGLCLECGISGIDQQFIHYNYTSISCTCNSCSNNIISKVFQENFNNH